MESHFRPKFGTILVLALVLVFSIAAFAQGSGELTGVVTDPTGAVVPSIEVKLTNSSTGIVRTTVTNAAGVYRFPALPVVGTYDLAVDAKGFKSIAVKAIVVSVGTTVAKDVRLEIGGSNEVVNVEGGVQMVQTTESSVSQLIDSNVWKQMPLETRNQNAFITLVAGVVPDEMAGSTRGASVNGTRGGTGNYMVEGMDNNDQGQGGRGQLSGYDSGGAVTSISPDAIQEYRVITNSFAAEYGKAGGFVTDTVLKSGTNQYHGSLFEYNRVQALAANGFFENRNGIDTSLVRNQFGGAFGGPILKDRTFFYSSLEFHRARSAGALTGVGTTQQFLDFVKSGQFETFMESDPNGVCVQVKGSACAAGSLSHAKLGPIFEKLFAQGPFPLATSGLSSTGAGLYTDGLHYPVPVYGDVFVQDPYHLNEYRISNKLDHKIGNNDQLSGVFLLQHAESGDPYQGGGGDIGPAYTNNGVSLNLGVTWNHTFSPTVLNSFKVSYLRHRSDFPAPEGTLGIPQILTYNDPMTVGFGLYSGLPQYFTDNQFQYQDSLSFVHGKHSFKTGAEYRRIRNGSSFFNDTFGTFYPWGVEDLVTDLYFTDELERAMGVLPADQYGSVAYTSAAVDPTTNQAPIVYRGFRANEMAAYFQDDWRVSNRLTLNWGMRYEYFGPPHNFRPNIDSNFYFGTPVTPVSTTSNNVFFPTNSSFANMVATGTFQVRNNSIWNKDTNNFAPRFGLSYDVFGNQKLVVRAGAGVMYDRIWNNLFENIRFNPPYFSDNQTGALINGVPIGAMNSPGIYTVPFNNYAFYNGSGTSKPIPNPRHMDQNIVSPYYEQFHFGFQWEFAKGYVFEPEYVGTMGHKLTAYRDINTFNGRVACTTNYAGGTNAQKAQWAKCLAAGVASVENVTDPETGEVSQVLHGLSSTRINTNIGADNYRSNDYSSNYHGLQLTVRKSYSNGLSFNSSYTYSKALDTISDAFNSRQAATVTDPTNIKLDYGPADFNIKHRFVTSFSYELPFMKQNRWVGGWGLNGIISVQTGVPFTPYSSSSSYDLNKNGLNSDRVVPTSLATSLDAFAGSGQDVVDYMARSNWSTYTCPATVNSGLFCNPPVGRGSMTGPGYWNTDLGLTKKFKVNERAAFQFQANMFNLFNHTNFNLPSYNLNSGSFGTISSVVGSARVTQLALRFDF